VSSLTFLRSAEFRFVRRSPHRPHVMPLDVTKRNHRVIGQRRKPVRQPSNRCPKIPKPSTTGEAAVDLVERCENTRCSEVPRRIHAFQFDCYRFAGEGGGARVKWPLTIGLRSSPSQSS
jgi:hypothetical protein